MKEWNTVPIQHRRWILVAWGIVGSMLLLFIGIVGYSTAGPRPAPAITAWDAGTTQDLVPLGAAPSFALRDQLDRPIRSEDFSGTVIVANFIYTQCADICPILSAQMEQLQNRLRQEALLGPRVQLLSFTVDPRHDTPAVLRTYAERYHADPATWHFLTGPEEIMIPLIVDGFKLGVNALPPVASPTGEIQRDHQAAPASEVMHSGRFILIDPQGQIRAYYDGQTLDLDQVVHAIRQLRP